MVVLAVLSVVFGVVFLVNRQTEEVELPSSHAAQNYTKVYTHHFDVVLASHLERRPGVYTNQTFLPDEVITAASALDQPTYVNINFNVISSNATPYSKLSDMEGDGYIISAFGAYELNGDIIAVYDARLVYDGNIMLYISGLGDGSVHLGIVDSMGDFVVEDSVTPI